MSIGDILPFLFEHKPLLAAIAIWSISLRYQQSHVVIFPRHLILLVQSVPTLILMKKISRYVIIYGLNFKLVNSCRVLRNGNRCQCFTESTVNFAGSHIWLHIPRLPLALVPRSCFFLGQEDPWREGKIPLHVIRNFARPIYQMATVVNSMKPNLA